jgi:astacin
MDPNSLDLNPAGFRSSTTTEPAMVGLSDKTTKEITCAVVGNLLLFEGDILIRDGRGIVITGDEFRWTAFPIGYVTQPGLKDRVEQAIAHWEARAGVTFEERTEANRDRHPDFISFEDRGGCFSDVGRQGGKQTISLGSGCTVGNAIHEIGHALGLWHEQSREDRNGHVAVHLENVIAGFEHNFTQQIADGDDVGDYDFGSIMHYPATAFSKNGEPTIVTKNGQSIGQRNGLSAGDVAAIRSIYPNL